MLIQKLVRYDPIIASKQLVVVFCNTIGPHRRKSMSVGNRGKSGSDRHICETALLTDTVEKGFWRGGQTTLNQDQEQTRNLDSKSHLAEFVCFKF